VTTRGAFFFSEGEAGRAIVTGSLAIAGQSWEHTKRDKWPPTMDDGMGGAV